MTARQAPTCLCVGCEADPAAPGGFAYVPARMHSTIFDHVEDGITAEMRSGAGAMPWQSAEEKETAFQYVRTYRHFDSEETRMRILRHIAMTPHY